MLQGELIAHRHDQRILHRAIIDRMLVHHIADLQHQLIIVVDKDLQRALHTIEAPRQVDPIQEHQISVRQAEVVRAQVWVLAEAQGVHQEVVPQEDLDQEEGINSLFF